jgi:BirA family transcriptional regulator, biotin operon repressor / biotin---[acetyl-CoA-carboxylase] ligase
MLINALAKLPFVERFYSCPTATSTNDLARAMTEFPDKGVFVFLAGKQTQGRGRSGAAFFSASEKGLWATILSPLPSIESHFVHNRSLSLAIAGAVEAMTGIAPSIKWPNDIYLNTLKLCGILLENHPARPNMLVLGFGINVNTAPEEFPEELRPIATSLLIETGKIFSRSLLLQEVITRYEANLRLDPEAAHTLYSQRLYRSGDQAEIGNEHGVFEGVEIDGRLRLRGPAGVIYFLSGHLRFPD